MISTSKLVKLARKWKNFAAIQRMRISFPRDSKTCAVSKGIEKGHFVVYTNDNTRFVFPLSYLKNETFKQLLIMSEEEFGLPANGPIILPCTGLEMEYIISIINGGVILSKQRHEKTLHTLVSNDSCSSIMRHQDLRNQSFAVC